jgi:adenylylsulfate kinase
MIKEIIFPHKYYEVFVSCPLEVCEERDPKFLYKEARKKCVNVMTGLGSKYEEPENPDLIVDTNLYTIDECAEKVINILPL